MHARMNKTKNKILQLCSVCFDKGRANHGIFEVISTHQITNIIIICDTFEVEPVKPYGNIMYDPRR